MTYSNRKVGGIRFIRMGRLQVSLCWCKPKPKAVKDGPGLRNRLKTMGLREIHAIDWALLGAALVSVAMTACTAWAQGG
jgi:hypothetical protein